MMHTTHSYGDRMRYIYIKYALWFLSVFNNSTPSHPPPVGGTVCKSPLSTHFVILCYPCSIIAVSMSDLSS